MDRHNLSSKLTGRRLTMAILIRHQNLNAIYPETSEIQNSVCKQSFSLVFVHIVCDIFLNYHSSHGIISVYKVIPQVISLKLTVHYLHLSTN